MVQILHKQIACGFDNFIKTLVLFGLLNASGVLAQDTISLNQVEITSAKHQLSQLGKRHVTIDSLTKDQFRFASLADVLNYNSQVFIKSYGSGALATTAFRGGNASQTAILWNGFNLQNAMLGQSDLSLLPAILFEQVEIEYGGSSSLWGTGAVGGSIHLNNKPLFAKGFTTITNLAAGSFGELKVSTAIAYSNKRFSSVSKLYLNDSKNTFAFKDTSDKEEQIKKRNHAAYNFKGLMQELKWLLNQKHTLTLNGWVNSNQRQLPGFVSQLQSKSYQTDEALRISASWDYNHAKFRTTTRAAHFTDRINYTDSLSAVFSKSTTKTTIVEHENYFTWAKNNQLNTGVSFNDSRATSNNYSSNKGISRFALMAGNKFSMLSNKFLIYTSLRLEYFSAGKLPLTGSLAFDYKLNKQLSLSINTGRVYRQPTLNELYWLPGGNLNLKPEQGYTSEGTINYNKQKGSWLLELGASAYSRLINNWILWVPGAAGRPTPLNIQQVHSRGTETDWKLVYQKKKFRVGARFLSAYVLSTILANNQENNESSGRQLIYTPRYTFNCNINVGYNKTNLVIYNQYVGYRFTTSDNAYWLPPYQLCSLRLSHSVDLNGTQFTLVASCNNLFNANYYIIAGNPMPLRNFELGITLKTNKKNKPIDL